MRKGFIAPQKDLRMLVITLSMLIPMEIDRNAKKNDQSGLFELVPRSPEKVSNVGIPKL
jgi:hypothetical protein